MMDDRKDLKIDYSKDGVHPNKNRLSGNGATCRKRNTIRFLLK